MAIDVGLQCADYSSALDHQTIILAQNLANASGTINYYEIQLAANNGVDVQPAVFTNNSGDNFTCKAGHHDSGAALTPAAGSCVTFDAPGDFDAFLVDEGEYCGAYTNTGNWEFQNGGSGGLWFSGGADWISDDETHDFTDLGGDRLVANYLTGTESAGANPNQTQAIIMGWLLKHPILFAGFLGLTKIIKRRQKLMK